MTTEISVAVGLCFFTVHNMFQMASETGNEGYKIELMSGSSLWTLADRTNIPKIEGLSNVVHLQPTLGRAILL